MSKSYKEEVLNLAEKDYKIDRDIRLIKLKNILYATNNNIINIFSDCINNKNSSNYIQPQDFLNFLNDYVIDDKVNYNTILENFKLLDEVWYTFNKVTKNYKMDNMFSPLFIDTDVLKMNIGLVVQYIRKYWLENGTLEETSKIELGNLKASILWTNSDFIQRYLQINKSNLLISLSSNNIEGFEKEMNRYHWWSK